MRRHSLAYLRFGISQSHNAKANLPVHFLAGESRIREPVALH
jgi:hypothetical protein